MTNVPQYTSDDALEKGSDSGSNVSPDLNTKPEEDESPEGGTKAWLSLLGASCAMFASFGWVNCIALFQAEYETNQLKNYSKSSISWITSMEFFFMLFMSPVAGWLFDNYGPRLPCMIGTVLHVVGLMMASLSKEYYQFMLSQSICSGVGASLVFTPCMTAPMTYFKKKRAIAGGLTIAGSSLGGIVFPLMAVHLIPKVGFPTAIRSCAFLILFMLIITNLTISSNINHQRKPFKLSNHLRPLKEPNYLILAVCCFFLYWALFVPFDYIVSAGIHYGMSPTAAFNLIPILNGASFVGRIVPNLLADRYGRFNLTLIMILLTGISVLAVWLPGRSSATSIVFAVLFGIGSGACIGLGPVLIMTISPMNEVGIRMGTIFAIAAVGCLTSPPIGGAIVDKTSGGNYDYAALFSGVNFFVTFLAAGALRVRLAGWNIFAKA